MPLIAGMIEPSALVLRSELVMFEIAKLVDVPCPRVVVPPTTRLPAESMVVVAVLPNDARPAARTFVKSVVPVAAVNVRPPLKLSNVVVALLMNGYAKFA